MQKKFARSLAVVCALGMAACAQDATGPVPAPQFAKGGGGSPHFILDETGCSLQIDGSVDCYYKIAGLASNARVVTTLAAGIEITYNCINPGDQSPPPFQNQSVSGNASATQTAQKSGTVTGQLSLDFGDQLSGLQDSCPNDNWTYSVTGFAVTGNPTLTALVNGTTVLTYQP